MSDLIAGLTVGLMVVPQALAYASIAGLPLEVRECGIHTRDRGGGREVTLSLHFAVINTSACYCSNIVNNNQSIMYMYCTVCVTVGLL